MRRAIPQGRVEPIKEAVPTTTKVLGVVGIDRLDRIKSEPNNLFKCCFKKEPCQIYPTDHSRKHGNCPIVGYHKSSRKVGTLCTQLRKKPRNGGS